jgi:hypothetical protein
MPIWELNGFRIREVDQVNQTVLERHQSRMLLVSFCRLIDIIGQPVNHCANDVSSSDLVQNSA